MRAAHTHGTEPLSRKKDEIAIVLNNFYSGSFCLSAGINTCRCIVYTYFPIIGLLPLEQSLKQ